MYGAIIGDMVGSPYEFDQGGKIKDFGPLFIARSRFTDDSVMTIAVAEALMNAGKNADTDVIRHEVVKSMKDWGRRYPDAGYGGRFGIWLRQNDVEPYGSYGNGSAMRVSPVGWIYDNLERTREVARATAEVTHNHPEGIKGAEVTASAIYMARTGKSKEEIKQYITDEFGYDLSRTLDEIRPGYHHVESCQETVPEAVTAFLEGKDFEDVVRNAVSLSGDCDTLTCIAAGIAEAFYGIPIALIGECLMRIEDDMQEILERFDEFIGRTKPEKENYLDNKSLNYAFNLFMDAENEEKRIECFTEFFNVLTERISEGALAPTPFVDVNGTLSKSFDPNKIKTGDTIEVKDEVRLRIDTMKDSADNKWIPLFMNEEELQKGETANITMPVYIHDLLQIGLNDEKVMGVVINPFGKPYALAKDILKVFLDRYKEWSIQNGIETPGTQEDNPK